MGSVLIALLCFLVAASVAFASGASFAVATGVGVFVGILAGTVDHYRVFD